MSVDVKHHLNILHVGHSFRFIRWPVSHLFILIRTVPSSLFSWFGSSWIFSKFQSLLDKYRNKTAAFSNFEIIYCIFSVSFILNTIVNILYSVFMTSTVRSAYWLPVDHALPCGVWGNWFCFVYSGLFSPFIFVWLLGLLCI